MKKIKDLIKSFFYAFRGIGATVISERNMRIHIVCMIYMFSFLGFTDWFDISKTQLCILLLCCSAVISGELINTALESAVNMVTMKYNELAKKAKDAASGAVLVSAIFSVIIGIIIMYQPSAFKAMFVYFKAYPLIFAAFILSVFIAVCFIFFGVPERKEK